MDQLFLNTIGFPVRSGTLSRSPSQANERNWSIEISCGESPQLDCRNREEESPETEFDWLAGAEPSLYSHTLPLPADSPGELVGQTFSFPQSPHDEQPEWDKGEGWLFFCLYVFEHDLVFPTTVTFTERQDQRYRVKIVGTYRAGDAQYVLQVEAWLDWVEDSV